MATLIYSFSVPEQARLAFKPLVTNRLLQIERNLIPAMKESLYSYMQDVVDESIARSRLNKRSGGLESSLYRGIKVRGTNLSSIAGRYEGVWYAKLLSTGGRITPTNAEVLTLPLPAALRPDGTPKLKGPTAWKRYGTFSYTSKRTGQGYLAYKNAQGKLVLLYVYVDVVRVKKRLPIKEVHNQNLNGLVRLWGDLMVQAMLRTDLYGFVRNPNKRQTIVFDSVRTVRRLFRPSIKR